MGMRVSIWITWNYIEQKKVHYWKCTNFGEVRLCILSPSLSSFVALGKIFYFFETLLQSNTCFVGIFKTLNELMLSSVWHRVRTQPKSFHSSFFFCFNHFWLDSIFTPLWRLAPANRSYSSHVFLKKQVKQASNV